MITKKYNVLFLIFCLLLIQSGPIFTNEVSTQPDNQIPFDTVSIEQQKSHITDDQLQPEDFNEIIVEDTTAPHEEYHSETAFDVDRFLQESIDFQDETEPLSTPDVLEPSITRDDTAELEEQSLTTLAQPPVQVILPDPHDQDTQAIEHIQDFIEPEELVSEPEQIKQESKQDIEINQEYIEFSFEDADITNLLAQITEIFDVKFITDDSVEPLGPGSRALKGNKISFKTHKPLTKKAAWGIFLTFLDLAGFALIPESEPGLYRVVTTEKAQKSHVPTYIGVNSNQLPDNDQIIRYVYFIENASTDTIKNIVDSLKTPNAPTVVLQEIRALIITDKAYNIKSLMEVIHELDQVTMPQAMAVIKLTNADATDVKALYDTIMKTDEQQGSKLFARKQPTTTYFTENARIIAEPRSNSLIIFGSADAIAKIEDFIRQHIDVDLEKPYSPLQPYQLRYASSDTIAKIMNEMTEFGSETAAGRAGGVRAGDKYLKPMSFTSEPATNTIIIKGNYEDYLKALEIIKQLDAPQPQIAVEALLIGLDYDDRKELGTQLRNRVPESDGLLGTNVAFQTSGMRAGGTPQGIVTNPSGTGSQRLLGNLISLVQNAPAGNTVVSLGADAFGVWGIFDIFQSILNVQVVSNPFLVATNKTKAKVSVADIRRVVTSQVFAGTNTQDALGDFSAELSLEVTPQINSDGMIVLNLEILYENFISPQASTLTAAKQSRKVVTKTIVADKEVIAIGGLIQTIVSENLTKVPILGDIPIIGWAFKNKSMTVFKRNLLVLISTRIIEPEVMQSVDAHTQLKLRDYYEANENLIDIAEHRDPIYKRFFQTREEASADVIEDFLFNRIQIDQKTPNPAQPAAARISRSEHLRQVREKTLKGIGGTNPGRQQTPGKKPVRSRDARRGKGARESCSSNIRAQ